MPADMTRSRVTRCHSACDGTFNTLCFSFLSFLHTQTRSHTSEVPRRRGSVKAYVKSAWSRAARWESLLLGVSLLCHLMSLSVLSLSGLAGCGSSVSACVTLPPQIASCESGLFPVGPPPVTNFAWYLHVARLPWCCLPRVPKDEPV